MTISEIINLTFSILGAVAIYILNDLKKSVELAHESIKDATKSITELNVQVGIMVQKNDRNERDIIKNENETTEIKKTLQYMRQHIHDLGNHINALQIHGIGKIDWVKSNNKINS
jgi:hypothetical protein